MAGYTTLRRGSTGEEVKKLQTSLGITADGKYGPQTESAVRDYQQKNGLSVDGIAGNQTLGKLYGGSTAAPSTTTPTPQTDNSFKYEDFQYTPPGESETVKQAEAMLQQFMANKPGQTQSVWTDQLNDTINKILNKEKFSYDLNGDALYQQYKDQYVNQGQQAMMDTMGQAQVMTGGYGNSYAQTVGQQTYQGYLQQLNDKVPELYQIALNQYNQEKEDLYNQASVLANTEQKDYDRGRDELSDYYAELDYITGRADTAYDREVDNIDMALGLWADKQKYNYDITQSNKSDANTLAMSMLGMGVMPSADVLTEAGISPADAQAIANKVKQNESKAASGKVSSNLANAAKKAVGWITNGNQEDDKTPTPDTKEYYADWDAGMWEGYFANIRQTEGKAAAEEELKHFTSNGFIPTKFVTYGAIGARGSSGGH